MFFKKREREIDGCKVYRSYFKRIHRKIIGFIGDEVIYLDPHTTQRSGSVEDKINEEEIEMDITYHCKSASRIPIMCMDPSVALVSI